MKVKLGQTIRFTQNRKISIENGGTVTIKKGDMAQVLRKVDNKSGEILYLTGEAKGKSQIITMEIDDKIDVDKVSKEIMAMLNKEI
ncbi:hypothetical protein [Hathewaya limosa]|uniref:Uncharacterized protein n=1 Tax=Hathewaya limosa TaxID=1536 RepID=A0ABU0JR36_HATLI|nr:hypothetical protein [Hathewaya limosa]MDQ0479557.1 hypothetical protein [Hathewaya limosa]